MKKQSETQSQNQSDIALGIMLHNQGVTTF